MSKLETSNVLTVFKNINIPSIVVTLLVLAYAKPVIVCKDIHGLYMPYREENKYEESLGKTTGAVKEICFTLFLMFASTKSDNLPETFPAPTLKTPLLSIVTGAVPQVPCQTIVSELVAILGILSALTDNTVINGLTSLNSNATDNNKILVFLFNLKIFINPPSIFSTFFI